MYANNKAIKAASLIPVVLVVILFCFEWYTFNVAYAMPALGKAKGSGLALCAVSVSLFQAVWVLALWSYGRAVFSDPGLIPGEWRKYMRELELHNEGQATRRSPPLPPGGGRSSRRWSLESAEMCDRCQAYRPRRAHHCQICGRCVMRMDHHCPWIGNCVGFKNHKYFILFALYTALGCTQIVVCILPQLKVLLLVASSRNRLEVVQKAGLSAKQFADVGFLSMGTALAASLAVALGSFFGFHCWLLLKNCTSVEIGTLMVTNPFDLGPRANAEQLLGVADLAWFLPVPPLQPISDGLAFETVAVDPADATGRSLHQGVLPEEIGLKAEADEV